MKLKWLGHSAFLLTAADGTAVVTDPYLPGSFLGQIKYGPIRETTSAVTVSHHHQDHDGVSGLPGQPAAFDRAGAFKTGSITVTGFDTYHDEHKGAERGPNVVFVFDADGLRVCHCGDLGHVLTAHQAAAIGKVDVLLLPVGGTFTVNAAAAHEVAEQLAAKVTIPMHYKTDKLGFNIDGVEAFTRGEQNVKRIGRAEVEVSAGKLPPTPEIWVLEHAL